KLVQLLTTT
nr:Chain C, Steroid Receptor Coactivator-1 [synthetic construct]1U9E_D Chain D, Steroid Receptor Coactivator-1 [synthetic construct]